MRNKIDGKVYLFSSDNNIGDFTKFVEQFATNMYHFAIRKGTRIILCVKSEGNPGNAVGIVINEKISPGSIILRVSEKHWLSGAVLKL